MSSARASLLVAVWLVAALVPAVADGNRATNSVDTVVEDMTLPHEGHPKGVPEAYDWSRRPRVGMGNDPGAFRAVLAWGQLYEDERGNPAGNTRVQIRNIEAYVLEKQSSTWRLLQRSEVVDGGAYREDFAEDAHKSADVRSEPDGGGISVSAGGGYNFHFWARGRTPIDPTDIAGIFTTVEARLVVDDPAKPDDRDRARYLLCMGGDYWLDEHATWNHFKTNNDIGIGRFKYVRIGWRSFNMSTLSEAQLRKNPPPLR